MIKKIGFLFAFKPTFSQPNSLPDSNNEYRNILANISTLEMFYDINCFDNKIRFVWLKKKNGLMILGWKRKKYGHSGRDGQQPMRPFSQTYNMCYKNTEQKYHKRFSRLHPWKIASFKHYLQFPGKMCNFQKRSKRRLQKKKSLQLICDWIKVNPNLSSWQVWETLHQYN